MIVFCLRFNGLCVHGVSVRSEGFGFVWVEVPFCPTPPWFIMSVTFFPFTFVLMH